MSEAARGDQDAGGWKPWVVYGAAAVAVAAVAASWGGPHGLTDGLAWVLAGFWHGVLVSAPVLGTAWGLGGWLGPVVRGARERAALRLGAGLAVLLFAWFTLGTIGLLGPFAAWGMVGLAVTRVAVDVIESRGRLGGVPKRPAGWAWAGLLGLGVLFVAAASPVGGLWASEYRGYDVISYHLPLAEAWIASGRVWPVEHNAYSYLPLAIESLFAWAAVLTGASGERALLDDGGWRLVAMQQLHAWIAVVGVWMTAAAGRRVAAAAGMGSRSVRTAGWVAGGLAAVTPWLVVVGSMAYNEAGVVALGAAALAAAFEPKLSAWRRGVLCGGLVGVACLIKPTALVLVGPGVAAGMALVCLRKGGPRALGAAVVVGGLVGVIALTPWLARNVSETGNPVFPLMTGVFGEGHWTPEQAARWDEAHAASGGIGERLRLAAWTDPAAAENAEVVERWRGLTNPQWGVFWGLAVLGGAIGLVRARAVAGALSLGVIVSLLAWLVLTHIQSRFLVPMIPVGAALAGLGVGVAVRTVRGSRGVAIGAAVVGLQAAALVLVWANEAGGQPNRLLAVGTPVLIGQNYSEAIGDASPPAWVNANLPEDARLLMVGDAGVLFFDRDVVWATVWDQPAVLPGGSGWQREWTRRLGELGVTHVLVNLGEVERLRRSGYADLTPDEVLAWARRQGPLVRAWPDRAIAIYRVGG
jgi:hypothetical protein